MALEDMAAKGAEKLERRVDQMQRSWRAARPRMIEGFREVGFGPTRVANFETGINEATYRAPDPQKWRRNWLAKMRE